MYSTIFPYMLTIYSYHYGDEEGMYLWISFLWVYAIDTSIRLPPRRRLECGDRYPIQIQTVGW